MGSLRGLLLCCLVLVTPFAAHSSHAHQQPLFRGTATANTTLISQKLFWELEELARIVDISYCVGTAGLGIKRPFSCASRCADRDFETFDLVTVSRCARICVAYNTNGCRHGTRALSCQTRADTSPSRTTLRNRALLSPFAAPIRSQTPLPISPPYPRNTSHTRAMTTKTIARISSPRRPAPKMVTHRPPNRPSATTALFTRASIRPGSTLARSSCHMLPRLWRDTLITSWFW